MARLLTVAVVLGVVFCVVCVVLAQRLNRRLTDRQVLGGYGLVGIVGRMGSGKTYLAADLARRAVAAGRPVLANFAVDGGRLIESWDDVLSAPHREVLGCCDGTGEHHPDGSLVLLDEVQLWWPSRAWRVPTPIAAWCSQLRKRRISCYWTTQHETHVGKRIMQLSSGVWLCRVVSGVHVYRLMDPNDVGRKDAVSTATVRLRRDPAVMASYDTTEVVTPACSWETAGAVREGRTPAPPSTIHQRATTAP